jgi:adenylate kinase family enzyme
MKTKRLNSICECGHSRAEHTNESCSKCECEGYNEIEEAKKQEPILIQYIRDRVENRNKNFIMLFVGATGSGKSLSALRLAEMLDDSFDIGRVNFKAKDFMNTINSLVERSEKGEIIKGKVIVWDEFGVEHNAREFMTISNRVINYFFQTSRHLNLIVIMTVPLLSFIDSATRKLMHGVAEMKGINMRKKTATVRVKMLQTNVMTGKEYPKYLRFRRKNKTFVSKKLKFKLPSKELLEAYEEKKKAFTTQLNQEIMNKLLRDEAKDNKTNKALTDTQERVARLLQKHSAEETADKLGITLSSLYGHKTNIERKGYAVKPVWKNKRIIRYYIEGLNLKTGESTTNAQV